MLQQLFGTQLALPIRMAIAAIVIAALLGLTVLVMRRVAARGGGGDRRVRSGPRLSVVESVVVDQRRRLVLVRRDEVEHLLLIGGSSDLVVEHLPSATEPAETRAPAIPPTREAPTLQRPVPRRGLPPTAPSAAALEAEPVAAGLPAPEATPEPAAPPPAPPAAPAPRDDRRTVLARRPLLRGDGTLSGRPAGREGTPVEAPRLATPPAAAAVEPELAPPARIESKVEPRSDAGKTDASKIEALRAEPAEAPQPETARRAVDESIEDDDALTRLEDMAHQLEAALVQPSPAAAAPQLSLSDLLGEGPAKTDAPSAPPRSEPVIESPQVRASDRPLSRFLTQSRSRAGEARGPDPRGAEVRPPEPQISAEPRPRFERQVGEPALRPPAPAGEPSLRPREFAFRPASAEPARPLPALEQPRRDPIAQRDMTREEAPRVEMSPLLRPAAPPVMPLPAPAPDAATPDAPAMTEAPPLVAERSETAGDAAPRVDPPAERRDPLDDFDAEMANLLGRTTARSR
ncbi:flagellar biosynthetic protein FliO [Xanthobacter sp. KR7-65]|uniref:flagellar biosynthetic protein FliO n=1 Tax=Xanthobacter sp. KR7-65 TaxID=3156612 RepID=UPI0032B3EE2E